MDPQIAVRAIALGAVLTCALGAQEAAEVRELSVRVGKSIVLDSPVVIDRISVGNPVVAEAVAATPREIIINGRAVGETSLILWQTGGDRLIFDLNVTPKSTPEAVVREELKKELGEQPVEFTLDGKYVYLRGTVESQTNADRAVAIVQTLGTAVNLLNVKIPPVEPQILIKVRFADVDRAYSRDLGMNLFSTGATGTIGSVTTGGFSPPRVIPNEGGATVTLTDALNIFLFRPDLNLGATIRALQSKRLLEILAEPNLLAINGKTASFLAGGEFPFPTLQGGGGGLGAVTIQFREFGVRITFTPKVTPRGTIRVEVTPEVSSLDFANGLVFQGFTIPALNTRRVSTEVELESGQSFAIGGLLDNRTTETLNRVVGLGDIPFFGKLFRSRALSKNNTELLIVVTPELVRPMTEGMKQPDVKFPVSFLEGTATEAPRHPGVNVTGEVPVKPRRESMPLEDLKAAEKATGTGTTPTPGLIQFVPVPILPAAPQAPAAPPGPAAPAPPSGSPPATGAASGAGAPQR